MNKKVRKNMTVFLVNLVAGLLVVFCFVLFLPFKIILYLFTYANFDDCFFGSKQIKYFEKMIARVEDRLWWSK